MNTLGIQFSLHTGHAVIAEHINDTLICTTAKKIDCDFEKRNALHDAMDFIKSLYQKKMRVIVGIPTQYVMTKELSLDEKLNDRDIFRYLQTQSPHFFGHPAAQLNLDYQMLPSNEHNAQKIIAAAAHKIKIDIIETEFQLARIPLHVIDVDIFADARFKKYLAGQNHFTNKTLFSEETFLRFSSACGLCLWGKA
ncbi:MAG: hypothetical protein ACD_42C00225G0002 [uncultured bacterium]|nr:MAG: hypothetical protein ACD_42C00225G0002 [uncultured bacterium]OGT34064.1 MAG: hypothetical protein A3C44_08325 [Gammaproteobacteria bacterium RIFCSPHIGHO2_02_FULL_39_13]OGT49951.1 MAG: hypothetical protein A3E53_06220 [Gammaproteobacteria bacterium RIFCSPHIGHO2_12_FULL_39_24]